MCKWLGLACKFATNQLQFSQSRCMLIGVAKIKVCLENGTVTTSQLIFPPLVCIRAACAPMLLRASLLKTSDMVQPLIFRIFGFWHIACMPITHSTHVGMQTSNTSTNPTNTLICHCLGGQHTGTVPMSHIDLHVCA